MKRIFILLICFCFQFLTLSPVHAEDNKKFAYCGGNITFYIPASLDKKYIEKQSEIYTCKSGFIVKSKTGNKQTFIDIRQADNRLSNVQDFGDDYLAQFTDKLPHRLHYIITNDTSNGRVIINTFYWLNEQNNFKKIRKEIYFGKEGKFFAYASYIGNPNDPNDILFMNALEQLFLSAEIDW